MSMYACNCVTCTLYIVHIHRDYIGWFVGLLQRIPGVLCESKTRKKLNIFILCVIRVLFFLLWHTQNTPTKLFEIYIFPSFFFGFICYSRVKMHLLSLAHIHFWFYFFPRFFVLIFPRINHMRIFCFNLHMRTYTYNMKPLLLLLLFSHWMAVTCECVYVFSSQNNCRLNFWLWMFMCVWIG